MPPPREGAVGPHEKAKTTCHNRHCCEQRQIRQHEQAHIKDQRDWEIPQGGQRIFPRCGGELWLSTGVKTGYDVEREQEEGDDQHQEAKHSQRKASPGW